MRVLMIVLIAAALIVGCKGVFNKPRSRKPRQLDLNEDLKLSEQCEEIPAKSFQEKIRAAFKKDETEEHFYARIFELIWARGWNELNRKELIEAFRDETNTWILRWHGDDTVEKREVEEVIDDIIEVCLKNKTITKATYNDVDYYCMPEDKSNTNEIIT